MRKTFILTLVLCVVAAFAYAQTGSTGTAGSSGAAATTGSSSAGTTGTAATGTTGGKHKGHKAAANKSYSGTVASVDQTAKSFVVHPKKGEDITLKVNDKTKYYPKGKGWDDVKADASVHGKYHNDGTDNWAVTVDFPSGKKASKAKSEKSTGTTGMAAPATGTGK